MVDDVYFGLGADREQARLFWNEHHKIWTALGYDAGRLRRADPARRRTGSARRPPTLLMNRSVSYLPMSFRVRAS
jgi:hypothetical protein